MSKKSDQVKSGFAELDAVERQEVIRFINEFQGSTYTRQLQIKADMDRVSNKSVGPRDTNTCSCCGR